MNLHDRDLLERGYDEGVAVGIEEGYNSGIAEGESRGSFFAKLETARNLISYGMGSLEQIAAVTNLPLATIQQLATESIGD